MRSILLAALIAAIVPACTTDITGDPGTGGTGGNGGTGGTGGTGGGGTGGGDNGSGTGTADNGKVAVTVDQPAVSSDLGKTIALTYTVSSVSGYAGTVTVTPTITNAADGTVTGWTLTPSQASVTLTDGSMSTVTMNVMIPTDAMELMPIIKLDVSDGTSTAEVSSNFTIAKKVTIDLPPVGAGTHTDWPAKNAPLKIRAGTTVTFHNSDTIAHEIHSGGGIPHEGGALNPGSDYTTTNVTDDATWYCHIHGTDSALSRLVSVEQ
jgi:hypothetical protein